MAPLTWQCLGGSPSSSASLSCTCKAAAAGGAARGGAWRVSGSGRGAAKGGRGRCHGECAPPPAALRAAPPCRPAWPCTAPSHAAAPCLPQHPAAAPQHPPGPAGAATAQTCCRRWAGPTLSAPPSALPPCCPRSPRLAARRLRGGWAHRPACWWRAQGSTLPRSSSLPAGQVCSTTRASGRFAAVTAAHSPLPRAPRRGERYAHRKDASKRVPGEPAAVRLQASCRTSCLQWSAGAERRDEAWGLAGLQHSGSGHRSQQRRRRRNRWRRPACLSQKGSTSASRRVAMSSTTSGGRCSREAAPGILRALAREGGTPAAADKLPGDDQGWWRNLECRGEAPHGTFSPMPALRGRWAAPVRPFGPACTRPQAQH